MLDFKTISVGFLASIVTALAVSLTGASEKINPPASPTERDVAVGICQDARTTVTEYRSPTQHYFTALFDTPGLRYDLTWQASGTSIAVEKLENGATFTPWAEQLGPDFAQCVAGKPVTLKEMNH